MKKLIIDPQTREKIFSRIEERFDSMVNEMDSSGFEPDIDTEEGFANFVLSIYTNGFLHGAQEVLCDESLAESYKLLMEEVCYQIKYFNHD